MRTSTNASASRGASRGSSNAPRSSASRHSSSTSCEWITSWRGFTPRSCVSVEFAMRQPSCQRTDEPVGRDEHVGEEHLVELGLVGDLAQRSHLDTRRVHVDDERGDALALGRVGIGAREAPAPVGELRVARPHLLAVEHEAAVDGRRRAVESDARSLPAPGSLNSWHQISDASRMLRQPARLLLGRAVREQRRPDEVDADAADELRRAPARELLGDDVVLDRPARRGRRTRAASPRRPSGRSRASPATPGRTRPLRRDRRSGAAAPCRTPTAGSRAATSRISSRSSASAPSAPDPCRVV